MLTQSSDTSNFTVRIFNQFIKVGFKVQVLIVNNAQEADIIRPVDFIAIHQDSSILSFHFDGLLSAEGDGVQFRWSRGKAPFVAPRREDVDSSLEEEYCFIQVFCRNPKFKSSAKMLPSSSPPSEIIGASAERRMKREGERMLPWGHPPSIRTSSLRSIPSATENSVTEK